MAKLGSVPGLLDVISPSARRGMPLFRALSGLIICGFVPLVTLRTDSSRLRHEMTSQPA